MTINIKHEFSENQTLLLVMSSLEYNKEIVEIVKQLSGMKILYITLNKTNDSMIELFKKNKINVNNLHFIDAISKTIKKVEPTEKVDYISSPGSLTELSLKVSQLLKKSDYLIFDSLTNLLIYEKSAPVTKFVLNLVNKIRESETKAIFYALSVKEQESLIKESGMFVDKVIELNK